MMKKIKISYEGVSSNLGGIDVNRFSFNKKRTELREKMGFNDDNFLMLLVGMFNDFKNHKSDITGNVCFISGNKSPLEWSKSIFNANNGRRPDINNENIYRIDLSNTCSEVFRLYESNCYFGLEEK